MAKLMSLSDSDKRDARKAGFKRKSPKKPKASASLNALENWISRYNDYTRAAKEKVKEYKRKEADKLKRKKLADTIRRCC